MIPWCDVIILAFFKRKTLNCGKTPIQIPEIFCMWCFDPTRVPWTTFRQRCYMHYTADTSWQPFQSHCTIIAQKVAKSKYFFNIQNESYSLLNSLSKYICFVGVRFAVQKLSVGPFRATSSSYSVKLCIEVRRFLYSWKFRNFQRRCFFKGGAYRNICTFGGTLM